MTTASSAGSLGGLRYLPVVAFAAVAGYVFMEMAARVTIVSGQSLGAQLGWAGRWLPRLTFGAVAFGCVAYQSGNLLGALGGLQLIFPLGRAWLVPCAAAIAALSWSGSARRIGNVMAGVVALMGLLFVEAAVYSLLAGGVPSRPEVPLAPATLLGLLGTTIVPYNFFLAAALGTDGGLADMRRGLRLSFAVGLVVTAAIVVTGAVVTRFASFADLADGLTGVLGGYGRLALGVGLFAAGFSSATTAPFAAAMAGRGLLGAAGRAWAPTGGAFRAVWLTVLGVGLGVALLRLDILSVILVAQVINGLLLPFIAAVVLYLANRRSLLGTDVNGWWQNAVGGGVLLYLLYNSGKFLLGLL